MQKGFNSIDILLLPICCIMDYGSLSCSGHNESFYRDKRMEYEIDVSFIVFHWTDGAHHV